MGETAVCQNIYIEGGKRGVAEPIRSLLKFVVNMGKRPFSRMCIEIGKPGVVRR